MEKISQWMDGELSEQEARLQLDRVKRHPELAERWQTYHLIGDALRSEKRLGTGFSGRFHDRLEREPVVIAPRAWAGAAVARRALPLAAAVAGISIVAWLGLKMYQPGLPGQQLAQAPPAATSPAKPVAAAPASQRSAKPDNRVREYMLAHQEFSPSAAMQGVGAYARTVSIDSADDDR